MNLPKNYSEYDAVGLSELIKSGEVSAEELLELAIENIETLNPELNAVTQKYYPEARSVARLALPDSPVSGVPFLMKDNNLFLKSTPTTYSSKFFRDTKPASRDSDLVQAWKDAGLLILGKTNLPEFAHSYVTEPAWRGDTKNPWDITRTPGGSSGGSAAAVASGMVPLAHANDAAGSIRVPAACTGLFGLKPTAGFVTEMPHFPSVWGGLNIEHVVSKSVRDSAVMLDISMRTRKDLATRRQLTQTPYPHFKALEIPVRKLTIGVDRRQGEGWDISDECLLALDFTVDLLRSLGHEVIETQLPNDVDIAEAQVALVAASVAAIVERESLEKGRLPEPGELEQATLHFMDMAKDLTATQLELAALKKNDVVTTMQDYMQAFDVHLSPTLADVPVPLGTIRGNESPFDVDALLGQLFSFSPLTSVFSVSGLPAMSVPLYVTKSNLPIGLQFAARRWDEVTLLQLASQLENARPWQHLLPLASDTKR